ncbi:MAG: amidohydrolase family protein [Gemmatimonadota bacterium]|nr:MAG: amidohydrolase family protein [Gemmatimonadota bacterium]
MTTRRLTSAGAVVLLAATVACNPGAGKVAYVGAELFDGTGAPLILDAVIVVSNGHIEAIGPPDVVSVPRGAREVRVDGRWIIPGLIDAHVHIEPWTFDRFLAYGVTSVRDMGGAQSAAVAMRDESSLGGTLAPRMYISGAWIDGAPAQWENATEVRTPTEARQAIDQLLLIDAAQAKIYTKITRRLLRPLMDEAQTLNLPVAAHLGKVDAVSAVNLGVCCLEHMSGVVASASQEEARFAEAHDRFFTGWNLEERSWGRLDSASLHRTARALVEADARIIPTLVLHQAWSRLTDRAYIDQLDLSGVPDSIQQAWNIRDLIRRAGIRSEDFSAFRRSRGAQDRFVRLFHREGGLVAAGTDASNQLLAPGASLHDELVMLVDAGLSPRDALLAATANVARLLETDSIGTLRPGAVADFVILNGNPLEDIANTREIFMVVFKGTSYRPEEFREGWQ